MTSPKSLTSATEHQNLPELCLRVCVCVFVFVFVLFCFLVLEQLQITEEMFFFLKMKKREKRKRVVFISAKYSITENSVPAKILYRLSILLLLAHHPQTPFPSPYPSQRPCYEWPIPLYRGRLRNDFACRRNLKQSVLSFSGKEYVRMDKTLSFGRRWSHAHSNALVAEAVFDTGFACDWGNNLPHRVIEPTKPCHQSVRPKLSCRGMS